MNGLSVLVAPRETLAAAVRDPRPSRWAVVVGALLILAGAFTLPRQLPALHDVLLGPGGPPHGALLWVGLRRLVILDRLLPPQTFVLAAAFTYVLAGAWLPRGRRHRRALVGVLILGLAPALVLRVGEAVTTWLIPAAGLPPGDIVALPRAFVSGPLLLTARGAAPRWLDLLDARCNLIVLWTLGLWAIGLRALDDNVRGGWQILVPALALILAGTVTWWLGLPAIALVLRGP